MSSPMSEPTRLLPVPQHPVTPVVEHHPPIASRPAEPQIAGRPLEPAWVARTGQQRIGDAERSAACEALSGHYAAGRLTDDELDARMEAAMTARTDGDLRRIVADLPAEAPRPSAPIPPVASRTPWSGLDVLALLTLLGTVAVALLGALAVLVAGQPEMVVVASLTAITAGLGGMALSQLLRRAHRSVQDSAVARLQRSSTR